MILGYLIFFILNYGVFHNWLTQSLKFSYTAHKMVQANFIQHITAAFLNIKFEKIS